MRKLLVLLSVIALILAGCASTGHDDDRTAISISLPENPVSGYQWIWGQMGAGHIELVDSEYNADAGRHEFIFRGADPGHVTLTFSSRNTDTGATASQEIYSVTVYDDLTLSYL